MNELGPMMERIRVNEQRAEEGTAWEILERENGRFQGNQYEPVEQCTLGDLQMFDIVGRGQYTDSVRRAIYTKRNMEIAVKIIGIIYRPSGRNEGRGDENMVQEAQNVRRSAHKNVVWLYGIIVEQQTCYMLMELMQANLDEVKRVMHNQDGLNLAGKSSVEDTERFLGCVTVAVVDGLAFLRNNARVIHRDIKPNNIMINDRGEVKICDFGVSKRLQTGISSSRANTSGPGCLSYMAPEQFSAEFATRPGYGSKSGVWSFAIALHECATGRNAHARMTEMQISVHVVNENPPRISGETGYSQNLRNFVDACLFKHEPDRASLVPTDNNCVQNKKFYKLHAARPDEERKGNVIEVLNLVTPHLNALRRNLGR